MDVRLREHYRLPFWYDEKGQRVFDADNNLVLEMRGWGRLKYLEEGVEIQDKMGKLVADLLNAHFDCMLPPVKEPDLNKFPTGWPVRCPNCHSMSFSYVSESTGNIRRYMCKKCGDMYLATWKGKPIRNAMEEPHNTKMEDWSWSKVVEVKSLSGPNANGDDFSKTELVLPDFPMETTVVVTKDKLKMLEAPES